MNNRNERNYTAPSCEGPVEAITKQLEELVEQKIANPHSLLAMLAFRRFIDALPYGTVTFETLTAWVEKAMESDPETAFILLNYAIDQALYLQKCRDTIK